MCDVIDFEFPGNDPRGYIEEGSTELTMSLEKEDDVWINPKLIGLGAKILCKHPDAEWHEMDIEPGKALHCPAETELKFVLPFPFSKNDPRFKND